MFQVLEVAIGLVLVFTLVSLGVSILVEWLSAIFAMRGKLLWKGIETMVGPQYGGKLARHPLLRSLSRRTWFDRFFPFLGRGKPSYIPAETFAAALLGVLQIQGKAAKTDNLVSAVENLDDGALKDSLQPLVAQASGDWAKAQANLEHWFDSAMDRVTGWYKRWSQLVLFLLGLGVAVWFGIDSLRIGQALWVDDELRAQTVTIAGDLVADEECGELIKSWTSQEEDAEEEDAEEDAAKEAAREKAKECLEEYQTRLADVKLPLVPFPEYKARKEGTTKTGAQDTGAVLDWMRGRCRDWGWRFRGLVAVVFGLLVWAGLRYQREQPAPESGETPSCLVWLLTLAGQGAILLLLAVGLSAVLVSAISLGSIEYLSEWLGRHLAGFLLTAVAVSFGAPFWFDLLGKLVKLRNAGGQPGKATSKQATSPP